jgi:hypothetical protein
MATTYTIQVHLLHLKPKVWREIVLDSELPLEDVHKIIQTTMGWSNSHLHQFCKGRTFYSPPDEEEQGDPFGEYKVVNYTHEPTLLSDLLKKKGDRLEYQYDFGDDWMHEIRLIDINDTDENVAHPVCIGGERACPIEDSGGPPGYMEMLKTLQNPEHEMYAFYAESVPEHFDPGHFDRRHVNELLKSDNYGVLDPLI